jgi:hypothetical protein
MTQLEEITKEAISNYLKTDSVNFKIILGEDPPDYYYINESEKIPLEMTSTVDVYLDDDKKIVNRKTSNLSLIKLINYLDLKYKTVIPENNKYLIILEAPIKDYRKFKKLLDYNISEIIADNEFPIGKRQKKLLNGNTIIVVKYIVNSRLTAIAGGIGVKFNNHIYDVQFHTDIVISTAIENKEFIMRSISGKKWLGIYCNNYFDGQNHYVKALNNFKVKHSFTRIFIVFKDKEVIDKHF